MNKVNSKSEMYERNADKIDYFLLKRNLLIKHRDITKNEDVFTLTDVGLELALRYYKTKQPLLYGNVETVIDYDREVGCGFSSDMRRKLFDIMLKPIKSNTRKHYIVHRDGHTSVVSRENISGKEYIFLNDSYNAFGIKESDHLPLLKIIKKAKPDAIISVNHDKFQNDYYNCRTFSLMIAGEVERCCRNSKKEMFEIFNNTNDKYANEMEKINLNKKEFYVMNEIVTHALPNFILQMAQSYKLIDSCDEGSLIQERKKGQTYLERLDKNSCDIGNDKKINLLIENKYKSIKYVMAKIICNCKIRTTLNLYPIQTVKLIRKGIFDKEINALIIKRKNKQLCTTRTKSSINKII